VGEGKLRRIYEKEKGDIEARNKEGKERKMCKRQRIMSSI
jgi:hypothetical protein